MTEDCDGPIMSGHVWLGFSEKVETGGLFRGFW